MKNFNAITATLLTASLLCLTFPQIAHAATHEGKSFTLPQLLVFGLVMGWYLFNHFKSKIMELLKKDKQKPK